MPDGAVADELGLPDWDFWFFADETVLRLNYTEDGTFVDREVLAGADPAEFPDLRQLLRLRPAMIVHQAARLLSANGLTSEFIDHLS